MNLVAKCLMPILVALSACGGEYKFVNVPYCKAPEGAATTGFVGGLNWLYTSGDSSGSGPLDGFSPSSAPYGTSAKQVVLALISCPNPIVNKDKLTDGLTADAVPTICPDQKVVFHGTLTATDDPVAKAKGYDGVVKFPDVDLACKDGTLTKTTSADLEQRSK